MFLRGRLRWLHPTEQVEFLIRRHWIALLGRVSLPVLILVLAPLVNWVVDFLFDIVGLGQIFPLTLVWLVTLAWLIWQILDWENDHLIVTNERLVLIERVYFIRELREEAPLQRIQDITVRIPSLPANLLGYGELVIETAGRLAPIRFGPVGNPRHLQAEILRLAAGASAYGQPAGLGTSAAPPSAAQRVVGVTQPLPQAIWERFLSLFIVLRSTLGRDPIIYRKHRVFLFLSELVPLGAVVVWLLGLLLRPEVNALLSRLELPRVLGAIAYLLIGLVIAWWILYNFIDWWNDIYVLNQNQVIDVNKVPLRSEDRRQASLGAIQDVRYNQPNPISKLLDYGNLVLDTAGLAGEFTFERVPHPRQVQQAIFERVAEFRERASREERDKRAKEILEVVDKWWQAKQQAPPP
jgi:uncharacterized membrane protein YdbT with pleckstrin-like domain